MYMKIHEHLKLTKHKDYYLINPPAGPTTALSFVVHLGQKLHSHVTKQIQISVPLKYVVCVQVPNRSSLQEVGDNYQNRVFIETLSLRSTQVTRGPSLLKLFWCGGTIVLT